MAVKITISEPQEETLTYHSKDGTLIKQKSTLLPGEYNVKAFYAGYNRDLYLESRYCSSFSMIVGEKEYADLHDTPKVFADIRAEILPIQFHYPVRHYSDSETRYGGYRR